MSPPSGTSPVSGPGPSGWTCRRDGGRGVVVSFWVSETLSLRSSYPSAGEGLGVGPGWVGSRWGVPWVGLSLTVTESAGDTSWVQPLSSETWGRLLYPGVCGTPSSDRGVPSRCSPSFTAAVTSGDFAGGFPRRSFLGSGSGREWGWDVLVRPRERGTSPPLPEPRTDSSVVLVVVSVPDPVDSGPVSSGVRPSPGRVTPDGNLVDVYTPPEQVRRAVPTLVPTGSPWASETGRGSQGWRRDDTTVLRDPCGVYPVG